jgi:hypothetical protein
MGKNLISENSTKRNVFTLPREMKSGTYFWSITGNLSGKVKTSESSLRNFSVIKIEEITLFQPADNFSAGIFIDTRKQSLLFIWKKLRGDFLYNMQFSADAQFKNILNSIETVKNSVELSDFPDNGTYYWRVLVLNKDNKKDILVSSETRLLELKKTLKNASIEYPEKDKSYEVDKLMNMKFRWSEVPGATRYVFKIYQKNGNEVVPLITKELKTNYYYLDDISKMRDGTIVWEVLPQEFKKGEVTLTGTNSLSTFRITGVTLPKPDILPPQPEIIMSIQ